MTDPQPRIINVLLVEDDPGDVLMTREAFDEYLHNRLDVVTDGAEALAYLRKEPPFADVVRTQMTDYLSTLTPLLKPSALLGDYIQGGSKENTRKAEKVYKEVQALYEAIAPTKPFSLPRELSTPLNFPAATLEITPVEYQRELLVV